MSEGDAEIHKLPDIQMEAIEKFGVTNNPYEVGFILSDGSLLKKAGASFARMLLASGAINFSRVRYRNREAIIVEFSVEPSENQISVMRSQIQEVDYVSLTFKDSNTGEALRFQGKSLDVQLFSPKLEEIDKYFEAVKHAAIFNRMNEGRI